MVSPSTFSCEEINALTVFENHLPQIYLGVFDDEKMDLSMFVKGKTLFQNQHLTSKNIPKGPRWTWNQSRGKRVIDDFRENLQLTFFKLNTRIDYVKSNHPPDPPPKYKIWIFNLIHTKNFKEFSFFWCENGDDPVELDESLLADLCFLKDFIEPSLANEFGWTERFSKIPELFTCPTPRFPSLQFQSPSPF